MDKEKIELLKNLKEKDEVIINNKGYEVFKRESDEWYNPKKQKITERYKIIILYNLKEKPKVLIPNFYILKYNEKTGEIKFIKTIQKEVEKYPKDFPEKSKPLIKVEEKQIKIAKIRNK